MISDNINTMREKVARSCVRAGRSPSDVTLIAVAKTFPAEAVREAFDAGVEAAGQGAAESPPGPGQGCDEPEQEDGGEETTQPLAPPHVRGAPALRPGIP